MHRFRYTVDTEFSVFHFPHSPSPPIEEIRSIAPSTTAPAEKEEVRAQAEEMSEEVSREMSEEVSDEMSREVSDEMGEEMTPPTSDDIESEVRAALKVVGTASEIKRVRHRKRSEAYSSNTSSSSVNWGATTSQFDSESFFKEKVKAEIFVQLQGEMRTQLQAEIQAQLQVEMQAQLEVYKKQLLAQLDEEKKELEQMGAQQKSGSMPPPTF